MTSTFGILAAFALWLRPEPYGRWRAWAAPDLRTGPVVAPGPFAGARRLTTGAAQLGMRVGPWV